MNRDGPIIIALLVCGACLEALKGLLTVALLLSPWVLIYLLFFK